MEDAGIDPATSRMLSELPFELIPHAALAVQMSSTALATACLSYQLLADEHQLNQVLTYTNEDSWKCFGAVPLLTIT